MSVKPLQRSEILGFSKGFISDTNPLENIPDTTSDEQNFEMHKDGTRSRRLGLALADTAPHSIFGSQDPTPFPTRRRGAYLWEGAAGNPNNRFYVLQDGNQLTFYKMSPHQSWFGRTNYTIYNFSAANDVFMSMTAHDGKLVCTTNDPGPTVFTYDELLDTITGTGSNLLVRDMWGIQDPLAVREQDSELAVTGWLNDEHYYNLANQGWGVPRKLWFEPASDTLFDLVQHTQSPGLSASDVVWEGMEYIPVSPTSTLTQYVFRRERIIEKRGSKSKAPKGAFIIDAFWRGQSRREAWAQNRTRYPQFAVNTPNINIPTDRTEGGVNSVASYAGRLFYSGATGKVQGGDSRSPDYTNYVFFTQVTKNVPDYFKCYPEGNPTSEDSQDIVDTDGGYFKVAGASNIHTMVTFADKLFLFAENGIWTVSGGSDYGFSASNYRVDKLSDSGMLPGRSSVNQNDTVFYWGWEGIYRLGKNQYGDWEVMNVTKERHQNFYNSLPLEDKESANGIYDHYRNQIRWLYRSYNIEFDVFEYRELILDLTFNAFTKNKFAVAPPRWFVLHNLPPPKAINSRDEPDYSRFFGAYIVGVWNTNSSGTGAPYTISQYLTTLTSEDHQDWVWTGDARSEPAFMETNTLTADSFTLSKQTPYLNMVFKNSVKSLNTNGDIERPSSCIGVVKWGFSDSSRTNRWSRPQELFRLNRFYMSEIDNDIYNGEYLVQTKTKIRGSGKALHFRVETSGTNSCHIVGWGLHLTGNGVP